MEYVDFAFVWKEEQQKLHDFAVQVPTRGVIVEIGTAVGGTSVIFSNATKENSVNIYTVDPHASRRAARNLTGTGVNIISQTSEAFSHEWSSSQPIDLLYIDGDHSFNGIYTDFACWHRHLAASGRVVFHDYDPPQRGGIAHFAIRVFIDTLVEHQVFANHAHEYKLFSADVRQGAFARITPDHFIAKIRDIFRSAEEKTQQLFATSVEAGMRQFAESSAGLDGLEACVAVEYALRHDFECLDTMTHAFYDFRRWAEALSFLDHGVGGTSFVDYLAIDGNQLTIEQLSRRIALIQLRISLTSNLLTTLVGWKP